MKIRRLAIVGFKSFMDKVEISFPEGISAIVGPNGCGKSNIVDAIRWCMGEQSTKQLRARHMEDVIFSGAGNHKPLGMAEVTLVLEGGGEGLPEDLAQMTEISITRRLYRSGESEYLLNGLPCRLRDIQELFMDTGLGNRAYSVIGQGRIGAILEQKPEETRVMLEEAAGITKYRKKVEASQKKISLTQSNLQRLEDIMSEVQRQIRSLKRQASKARRYKRLTEEIRNLELTLYSNLLKELSAKAGERERKARELVEQEALLSAKVSNWQSKLDTLRLELEERDSELSHLKEERSAVKERLRQAQASLDSLQKENEIQREVEARLVKERERTEQRISALHQEALELDEAIEKINNSLDQLKAEISLREKRVKARKEILDRVKEEYEQARESLGLGVNKETDLKHESKYVERLLGRISDSRSRLEQELIKVEERLGQVVKASERKAYQREMEAERLRNLDETIETLRFELEELEEKRNTATQQLRDREVMLSKVRSRLGSLETLAENFEGFKLGVRSIMKAKDLELRQRGRILGLVADIISVDPKYEQAVEAVLSDKLQYIIVQTHEDGKVAVDYLKTKAKGRSSFIPIKELNGNWARAHQVSGGPKLRDLVTVPQAFKELVDALLGNTVVVEDLDQALAKWKENGRNQCLVTLEGDMVDERGIISGGRTARGSVGLLSRRREIDSLREQVLRLEGEVSNSTGQLQTIEKKMAGLKQRLEELTEERWSCKQEITNIDNSIFRLSQEMDRLEDLAKRIKEDLDKKAKDHEDHKRRLQEIKESLSGVIKLREQREAYFQEKAREYGECEREYEEAREALGQVKFERRVLEEEKRGMLREKERVTNFVAESKERIERINLELEQNHKKGQERLLEQERIKAKLENLYDDLERKSYAVRNAEQARGGLLADIKEKEAQLAQLRKEMDELKERIITARMEQSEIETRISNLHETVRDKFNLDLSEVFASYLKDDFSGSNTKEEIRAKREARDRLGEVNLTAIREHDALKERYEFMETQRKDLLDSIDSLHKAIRKINKTSLEKFRHTFSEIDRKLKEVFPILFNGGTAGLRLTREDAPLESGVLVEVRPPGKKLSHMGLLSGGEKALVAIALLFSIYMIKPSPFCLLDEVDAPLDEANIDRFNNLIQEIRKSSQVIMVTHNRRTMEIADRLYGVTMEEAGVSKIVSVDLEEAKKMQAKEGK